MTINFSKRRAKLAAHMLASKLPRKFKFDMAVYNSEGYTPEQTSCNTFGCIAGLTVAMFGTPEQKADSAWCFHGYAREILGLTDAEASALFVPQPNYCYSATEKQAGRVLAHFIQTGDIKWSAMKKPITFAGRTF